MIKRIIAAAGLLLLAVAAFLPNVAVRAQSGCQFIVQGAVLTAAQWNSCFQGKVDLIQGPIPIGLRGVLQSPTTFYVRSDGTDTTSCGLFNSTLGACQTGQAAVNNLATNYDLGGFGHTIYFVDTSGGGGTTYTGTVNISQWAGNGTVAIAGDANVVLNATTALNTINVGAAGQPPSSLILKAIKITNTGTGGCVNLFAGNVVQINGAFIIGPCTGNQIALARSASVTISSSYTITGGSTSHWFLTQNATMNANATVIITLSGTPAFSSAFARLTNNASMNLSSAVTFSGAATGPRYNVDAGATLNTQIQGATYLPGDQAGTTGTQGQYL